MNAETAPPQPVAKNVGSRLLSLDALRGFNMFWIIGGEDLVSSLLEKSKNPVVKQVNENLTSHAKWVGFHFYDMIFPLFLFIAGVALPYSIAKQLERGKTHRQITLSILQRTLTLFVCGLIYNGLLKFNGIDHLRIMGVLQRQALGYGAAALIYLYAPRTRQQIAIAAGLLLGYWAAMVLIHVPGADAGSMTEMGNAANYIDRVLFKPGQLYRSYGDPEGPFSTIPAVATAILGVLAGKWLRSGRDQNQKTLGLLGAGVALIFAGALWGIWFPIIKKIWTSSYVLYAGGWSLLLLALFYYLIDVKQYRKWTGFFVVIGVNPLTIYLMQEFVNFEDTAKFFVEGALKHLPAAEPVLFAASVIGVKWLVLRFLHQHKVYFRA